MSLNRYAKQRDANEAEIITALEAVGATVEQIDRPVDLIVGFRGATFLMEVKSPGGKLTRDQGYFFASWRGGDLVTVKGVDQALAAIGATKGGE